MNETSRRWTMFQQSSIDDITFIIIFLTFFFYLGDLINKYLQISRSELLKEFFSNILDLLFVLNFYFLS